MDKQFKAWIEAKWGKEQKTAWALINAQLIIEAGSEVVTLWAIEPPAELVGQSLPDLFPELIGVEDILIRLAHGQGEPFELCRIYRAGPAGEVRYFDLEISPWPHLLQRLLFSITDVTAQAQLEQQVQQQINEQRLKPGAAKG